MEHLLAQLLAPHNDSSIKYSLNFTDELGYTGNSIQQGDDGLIEISSKDKVGPEIEIFSPGYRNPNKPITVWAKVTDDKTGLKNATLIYHLEQYANGSLLNSDQRVDHYIPMNGTDGHDIYQARIPSFDEDTRLGLKVRAFDKAENKKDGELNIITIESPKGDLLRSLNNLNKLYIDTKVVDYNIHILPRKCR